MFSALDDNSDFRRLKVLFGSFFSVILSIFFHFAATLLPPNFAHKQDVSGNWWQSGSSFYNFKICRNCVDSPIENYYGALPNG